MDKPTMILRRGKGYHWRCDPFTKLVYLGREGCWHQFAKIETPREVWCEVLTEDLRLLEESEETKK